MIDFSLLYHEDAYFIIKKVSYLIALSLANRSKYLCLAVKKILNKILKVIPLDKVSHLVLLVQQSISCGADGTWDKRVSTFEECKQTTCPAVAPVAQARVVEFENDWDGIHVPGAVVSYKKGTSQKKSFYSYSGNCRRQKSSLTPLQSRRLLVAVCLV